MLIKLPLFLNLFSLITMLLCFDSSAAINVIDDDGNSVTLQKKAQRIISLSPHVTELIYSAGGGKFLVGAVNYSDYPEAAKKIPVIGDNRQLDLERILALKPDLVVVWRQGSSEKQADQLRRLGIPLFYSEAKKLQDIPLSVRVFGQLMGTESEANQSAAALEQRLAELTAVYAHRSPVRVFYQVWDKPLYTLSGQHIVSDAIRVCGGVNIFSELQIVAPNVSIEAVLQDDPEAIIATTEKNPSDAGVSLWKRYPSMTAVKRENLFLVDGNLLNRAGPRMIEGASQLCEKLEQARQHRK